MSVLTKDKATYWLHNLPEIVKGLIEEVKADHTTVYLMTIPLGAPTEQEKREMATTLRLASSALTQVTPTIVSYIETATLDDNDIIIQAMPFVRRNSDVVHLSISTDKCARIAATLLVDWGTSTVTVRSRSQGQELREPTNSDDQATSAIEQTATSDAEGTSNQTEFNDNHNSTKGETTMQIEDNIDTLKAKIAEFIGHYNVTEPHAKIIVHYNSLSCKGLNLQREPRYQQAYTSLCGVVERHLASFLQYDIRHSFLSRQVDQPEDEVYLTFGSDVNQVDAKRPICDGLLLVSVKMKKFNRPLEKEFYVDLDATVSDGQAKHHSQESWQNSSQGQLITRLLTKVDAVLTGARVSGFDAGITLGVTEWMFNVHRSVNAPKHDKLPSSDEAVWKAHKTAVQDLLALCVDVGANLTVQVNGAINVNGTVSIRNMGVKHHAHNGDAAQQPGVGMPTPHQPWHPGMGPQGPMWSSVPPTQPWSVVYRFNPQGQPPHWLNNHNTPNGQCPR